MKKNRLNPLFPTLFILFILIYQTTWAHDLWITMDADQLNKSGSDTAAVFSSHHFPAPVEDYLAPERADKFFLSLPLASI